MTLLRWAAVGFLLAGAAAAPLNILHAKLFSGAELARVPLVRGPGSAPQSYPPLILSLKPEQSPVAFTLEAEFSASAGAPAANRYLTHLISGSEIAAKAETLFNGTASDTATRVQSHPLLHSKINSPGVYSVLVSEAAAPAFALTKAALTVRANTRRADVVNVLAGIAFMLIGAVTLFATSKRRLR